MILFQGGPGIRGARGDRGEPGVTVCDVHFIHNTFSAKALRQTKSQTFPRAIVISKFARGNHRRRSRPYKML